MARRVIPPTSGGLHCGTGVPFRSNSCDCLSSRPPAAGSIAAAASTQVVLQGTWVIPPTSGGLHCGLVRGGEPPVDLDGHPAHQRRAPLRHAVQRLAQVVAGRPVIPPTSGGLHCGAISSATCMNTDTVIPPTSGGLHCGLAWQAGGPAVDIVIPPTSGGLHCGGDCVEAAFAHQVQVIPPTSGGLHCGLEGALYTGGTCSVIPPTSGGLHCGEDAPAGIAGRLVRSSRPPAAGSIAAPGHLLCRRRCLPGSSRPPAAGSIAARYRRPVSVPGLPVIPPTSGGLHCGGWLYIRRTGPQWVIPPTSGGLHCGRP